MILNNAGQDIGRESRNSTYTIFGDAEPYLGDCSENCVFQTHGEITPPFFEATRNSTIILSKLGNIKPNIYDGGLEATPADTKPDISNMFIATNEEVFEKLLSKGIAPPEYNVILKKIKWQLQQLTQDLH